MIDSSIFFVIFVIFVALVFDFTNGIHDAANSIATIVSTRGLTPRQAVAWAAFFNFVAFLIFGTAVAKTIGSGLIDVRSVTPFVIFAGLLGAIGWNIITWHFGLPTSSSHALIGGYAGAAIAKAGWGVVILSGWLKTILFIFLAPIIGSVLGLIFITGATWFIYKKNYAPSSVNFWSRILQFFSAGLYSLGHGGNDAQKTMGIIASLLFSAGAIRVFYIPLWVVLAAHVSIEHFTRVFKKGDKDIEIEHLQELLSADGELYQQKYITGYFGNFTEIALKKFQARHGLLQTGITDSATQKKLNTISESEERLDIPEDYMVFSTDLKIGNQGKTVAALQKYLIYEGSLSNDNNNGYFGKNTKAAVAKFQKKYGVIPPSGYVGYKTRHKMKQLTGL